MRGLSLHWLGQLVRTQSVGDLGATLAAGLGFRRRFHGSGALFALSLASLIVPSILVSLGIGLVFSQAGSTPPGGVPHSARSSPGPRRSAC